MSDPWEAELVHRARAGDEQAFADLVRRHADRAYAVALRMTGDPSDAQDVVQDALVAAWQHLDGFAGTASFATWLTRIVMNRCHNLRRDHRPTEPLDEDAADGLGESGRPGWSTPGVEAQVVARQQLAAVQEAILALPFDQRAALVLSTVSGSSHRETAAVLGTTEQAVRVRVHRARRALVARLGDWR